MEDDLDISRFEGVVTTELAYLKEGIARIEKKQDEQGARMDENIKLFQEIVANCRATEREENVDRDKRIGSLEKNQYWLAGGLASFAFLVGLLKDWILSLLGLKSGQ